MKTISLTPNSVFSGNLILVNARYPLRLVANTNQLSCVCDTKTLLSSCASKQLNLLIESLQASQKIVPVSGYRSKSEQEQIYQDSIRENGLDFTQCYVALPDCSEHQTGLAIDLAEKKAEIDFIRPEFPRNGLFGKFRALAAQYGWIERYLAGKESITGISAEPWHFRYVGHPHAVLIQRFGMVLEEYIGFIKQYTYHGQHLLFKTGPEVYEICYLPVSDAVTLSVPDWPLSLSGNNVDGVILTWRRDLS